LSVKIQVAADPAHVARCSIPSGIRTFTAPCDVARRALSQQALRTRRLTLPLGRPCG
jgi:hypothetical protein